MTLAYYDVSIEYHQTSKINRNIYSLIHYIYKEFEKYPYNNYVNLHGHSLGLVEWVSHDKDLINLSLKFQNVLFSIQYKSEIQLDPSWKKYYLNGKMQHLYPEVNITSELGSIYTIWPKCNLIESKIYDNA
jgi:hypothetical protein